MLHVDISKLDAVSDTGRNFPCDGERPRSSIGHLQICLHRRLTRFRADSCALDSRAWQFCPIELLMSPSAKGHNGPDNQRTTKLDGSGVEHRQSIAGSANIGTRTDLLEFQYRGRRGLLAAECSRSGVCWVSQSHRRCCAWWHQYHSPCCAR
jgi:hypothetical protein